MKRKNIRTKITLSEYLIQFNNVINIILVVTIQFTCPKFNKIKHLF